VLFNLQLKGIYPLIAHPERYREVQEHPNTVYRLIQTGCAIQVNSGSIEGTLGAKIQKTVNLLLEHKMVHAVGSDCHSSRSRMHVLQKSFTIVKKRFGAEYAKKLYMDNPSAILSGDEIDMEEVDKIEKKHFFVFK
jgi:protein-tyrosine phosphatase